MVRRSLGGVASRVLQILGSEMRLATNRSPIENCASIGRLSDTRSDYRPLSHLHGNQPMTRFVDLHTHVFNVGFLPVEGILLAHRVPPKLAAKATDVLERLLERDAPGAGSPDRRTAEDRDAFYGFLQREFAEPTEPSTADAPDFIATFAGLVPVEDIDALSSVLTAELDGELISESTLSISDERLGTTVFANQADLRRRLDRLFREIDRLAGGVETEIELRFGADIDIGGLVRWLATLVQHESRIAESFSRAWSGNPVFEFRVHHMMDMALHYRGRAPVYDFSTEQIDRMAQLPRSARPPLVGFTAFDPFRDDWEAIIDRSIRSGLSGVKFYPPNGYRAADNKAGDIEGGPTADEVNDRNQAFFAKCVALDLPIFTHCTPTGVESRPRITGKFSNPLHWRHVLETRGLERLRLCFGHAGGQEGWFAPDDAKGNSIWAASYAREVVELCAKYDNVYCDFGYFDRLLSGKDVANFRLRLTAAIDQYPSFRWKCCYGTDWHLVSIKKHAKDYPLRFADLLSGTLERYRDDILCGNAKKYLKAP
jgi:predicted TIM-barrel fold metal-dependent hydrolase